MLLKTLAELDESNKFDYIIAQYIVNHSNMMKLTASKIATDCFVSNSYITKFVKKNGYSSFNDFKMQLIIESTSSNTSSLSLDNFEINDYANEVLYTLINTTNKIAEGDIIKSVDIIKHSDDIQLLGIGGSAIVCHDFYLKLVRIGYNVKYEQDESIRKSVCKNATVNTTAIIFSYSGPEDATLECINILKNNGAKIIIITRSEFDFEQDIKIKIDSIDGILRQYSMFSRIGMNFISDLLYLYLIKK